MGGLFGGGGSKAPAKTEAQIKAEEAQARQAERAESQEQSEMQGAQSRRRLRRTGGMKIQTQKKLLELKPRIKKLIVAKMIVAQQVNQALAVQS